MKVWGLLALYFTGGAPPAAEEEQLQARRLEKLRKTEKTSKT